MSADQSPDLPGTKRFASAVRRHRSDTKAPPPTVALPPLHLRISAAGNALRHRHRLCERTAAVIDGFIARGLEQGGLRKIENDPTHYLRWLQRRRARRERQPDGPISAE